VALSAVGLFCGIAAALAPGDFDGSFGSGGTVVLGVAGMGWNGTSASVQTDGKVLAAGWAGAKGLVVRLSGADGSLDPSFGSGGEAAIQMGTGGTPLTLLIAMALQPDGKIVVGGYASDASEHQQFVVARLNTDGSLDSTFGTGGVVAQQLGAGATPFSSATAIALQPDGKILVAGGASNASGKSQVLVARLNTNGGFDASFGGTGTIIQQLGSGGTPASRAETAALQADGKLVVAGSATEGSGKEALLVARLNGDGSFDPSFGSGGTVLTQLGGGGSPFSRVSALALQPDGKVLAAGTATEGAGKSALLVARLNGDGSVDSSFGSGGTVLTQWGAGASPYTNGDAIALQPNGKVLLGGNSSDGSGNGMFLVTRLNSGGVRDASFGSEGVLRRQLGPGAGPYSSVNALALQPAAKVIAVGTANDSSGGNQALIARLVTDSPPSAAFAVLTNPARVGEPVSFDASASGDDGTIGSYSWDFGDGSSGTGVKPSHIYISPGTHTVKLTVTDDEHLASSVATALSVGPASPSPPVLSRLMLSPRTFRAAAHGSSIAAHKPHKGVGTIVSYRDSQAATSVFTVKRPQSGVREGKRCVAIRTHARNRPRRCRRLLTIGGFAHADIAGANSFRFTGRVRGHKLPPGLYVLEAVARNSAGMPSTPAAKRFRIKH
jgi:uncharacterized delta-60 repeat protein